MKIQKVIEIVNQMLKDGVIESYAIGGAVGATFYLEPVSTLDVDIFIGVKMATDHALISLRPIYDYFKSRDGIIEGEYIILAGWPVQFLPPTSPLVEEALTDAVTIDVDGTPARVFSAEHLAAIALQTGRAKDKARLLQFIEADAIDKNRFENILAQHGLIEKWRHFQSLFSWDNS